MGTRSFRDQQSSGVFGDPPGCFERSSPSAPPLQSPIMQKHNGTRSPARRIHQSYYNSGRNLFSFASPAPPVPNFRLTLAGGFWRARKIHGCDTPGVTQAPFSCPRLLEIWRQQSWSSTAISCTSGVCARQTFVSAGCMEGAKAFLVSHALQHIFLSLFFSASQPNRLPNGQLSTQKKMK